MRFSWSTHLLFGDFNIYHKDWLTCSDGTDRPVELCHKFTVSENLTLRWLTFLLRSQTVILIVLLSWIYLFLLRLVFVLQCLSFHWEIMIMLLSQFSLTNHIHNWMPCFIALLMTILMLNETVFMITWEMVLGGYI